MEIEQHIVGFTPEGDVILRYTLTNNSGLSVTLLNSGAAIESIIAPNGKRLTLSYPDVKDYLSDSLYMGKCVGRYAGRIAKGSIELDGVKYKLTSNERTTHYNGGINSLASKLWQARYEDDMIVFSYISPASEEGYPSELGIEVGYTLTENNELSITVMAESDGKTVANIAPFIYFTLGEDSEIMINSNSYVELDNKLLPNGNISEAHDTIYDFSEYKAITDEYDDYWIVDFERESIVKHHATLRSKESGVEVDILSTQPLLYMSSCDTIEGCGFNYNGEEFKEREAVLIAPQNIAYDTIDRVVIDKGERYHQQTIYKFKF